MLAPPSRYRSPGRPALERGDEGGGGVAHVHEGEAAVRAWRGSRRSRNLNTTSVDESRASPGPRSSDGFSTTTGRPGVAVDPERRLLLVDLGEVVGPARHHRDRVAGRPRSRADPPSTPRWSPTRRPAPRGARRRGRTPRAACACPARAGRRAAAGSCGIEVHLAGQVEHGLHAVEGGGDRAVVVDRGAEHLGPERLRRRRGRALEEAEAVAPRREERDQRGAEEAGAAGDEEAHGSSGGRAESLGAGGAAASAVGDRTGASTAVRARGAPRVPGRRGPPRDRAGAGARRGVRDRARGQDPRAPPAAASARRPGRRLAERAPPRRSSRSASAARRRDLTASSITRVAAR